MSANPIPQIPPLPSDLGDWEELAFWALRRLGGTATLTEIALFASLHGDDDPTAPWDYYMGEALHGGDGRELELVHDCVWRLRNSSDDKAPDEPVEA